MPRPQTGSWSARSKIVCEHTPQPFRAVGLWSDDLTQTSDEEVRELLEQAAADV